MTSARYDLPDTDSLPAIEAAAALRCLGFKVHVTVEKDMTSQGRTLTRWHVESAPADARDLVLGKAPAERLRLYFICTTALRARRKLELWITRGIPYYDAPHFAPTLPSTALPHTIIPLHLLDFAAAAIAAGHIPRAALASLGGVHCPSLRTDGPDGVNIQMLGAAEIDWQNRHRHPVQIHAPITIPGFPPEEHPYLYAREAIAHLAVCRDDALRAAGNPTGLFRGRDGRSAAVSASLLTDDHTASLLEDHLECRI